MDNDTYLIVVGSHGANDEGEHGGSSVDELETVFFAYCKNGLPMKVHRP